MDAVEHLVTPAMQNVPNHAVATAVAIRQTAHLKSCHLSSPFLISRSPYGSVSTETIHINLDIDLSSALKDKERMIFRLVEGQSGAGKWRSVPHGTWMGIQVWITRKISEAVGLRGRSELEYDLILCSDISCPHGDGATFSSKHRAAKN